MEITNKDYARFAGQVVLQGTAKLGCALIGLPIIAAGLLRTETPDTHPFYNYIARMHDPRYVSEGSSGSWNYVKLPSWKIMKPFDNLNYGLLGEPSGRWSAKRGGDERSYRSMFRQAAIRNPANGFRYMDAFSCQVDNCDIVYKGDPGPLDIQPVLKPGWNFVKAQDRDTGKVYYSFQYVRAMGKRHGFRIRLGFKVEPSHMNKGDIPEAKERATFTTRFNVWKPIDAFAD